ncbi:hypothetical protein AAMO2058_001266600 [Amorphochlora amoebiformis]
MMIGFEVFSHPLAPVGVAVTFLALGGLYMWYSAYSARKKQTMYESPAFWDRRYASIMANEIPPQEWYGLDDTVLSIVKEMATVDDMVHDLGCGQSGLCSRLRSEGFRKLSGSDFSAVLIEARRLEEKKRASIVGPHSAKIQYIQCDLRRKPAMARGSVKLVVDKATLDSIIYRRSSSAKTDAEAVWRQVSRMLAPDGQVLSISLNNEDIWTRYARPRGLEPTEPTLKLVRKLDGQKVPVNVYVRKYKLPVSCTTRACS